MLHIPSRKNQIAPRWANAKESLRHIAGAIVAASAIFVALSGVGETLSYYSNTELSQGNALHAGGVVLTLSALGDDTASTTDEGSGEKSFEFGVNTDESSLPVHYQLRAFLSAESPPQCGDIILAADFGAYHYEGPLLNFLSDPQNADGWWSFTLSVPSDSTLAPDALCTGEINGKAHADTASPQVQSPYSDEKEYYFSLRNKSAPVASFVPLDIHNEASSTPGVAETEKISNMNILDVNEKSNMPEETKTPVPGTTPAPETTPTEPATPQAPTAPAAESSEAAAQ
jgi:hypothetical protein